jgi:hypothetical protein
VRDDLTMLRQLGQAKRAPSPRIVPPALISDEAILFAQSACPEFSWAIIRPHTRVGCTRTRTHEGQQVVGPPAPRRLASSDQRCSTSEASPVTVSFHRLALYVVLVQLGIPPIAVVLVQLGIPPIASVTTVLTWAAISPLAPRFALPTLATVLRKLLPVVEHLTRQYRIVASDCSAHSTRPASSVGTSSSDKDRCRRPHSGRRKTHRR